MITKHADNNQRPRSISTLASSEHTLMHPVYVSCSNHTRRLQLQFIIQQYKSSSLHLKVDTKQEQQQKIETDANNIDECVFQDIEVGCVDELICTEDGTLEIATNNKSTGWSYGQFA